MLAKLLIRARWIGGDFSVKVVIVIVLIGAVVVVVVRD